MKKTKNNNLTSFKDHLDQQYGKRGTPEREKFEEGFEAVQIDHRLITKYSITGVLTPVMLY